MPVAVDTNVVIAALVSWHEHHERAAPAVDRHLRRGDLVLPVPALIESYAVMTRLPAPHRLAPADAFRILHESFAAVRLASLPPHETWAWLEHLAGEAIAGGRTYDAMIVRAALAAKATVLLTLNRRDLEPFSRQIEIVEP